MSSIFQLALTTALAAFAGSGLVFVLDWNTKRIGRRKEGKDEMLGAIQAHLKALEDYDIQFQQQALRGVGNGASNKGQFAPRKPSSRQVAVSFQKAALLFSKKAQGAIRQAQLLAMNASDSTTERTVLANCESEAESYSKLAICIAVWDGKNSELPRIRPSFQADGDNVKGLNDYPRTSKMRNLKYFVLASGKGKLSSYNDLNRG